MLQVERPRFSRRSWISSFSAPLRHLKRPRLHGRTKPLINAFDSSFPRSGNHSLDMPKTSEGIKAPALCTPPIEPTLHIDHTLHNVSHCHVPGRMHCT